VKRKDPAAAAEVPAWVRHDGFVLEDWAEASDFALSPRLAESAAWQRWNEASNAYLTEHPAVFDELMRQLRDMCRDVS
jgi:hypothetical protein